MNQNLIVEKSIEINASLQKIWDVLTKPELIQEYLYGTETVTTWEVGSEILFQGEYDGHKYRDHGKILVFNPLKQIVYSYWSGFSGLPDTPENYCTITLSLDAIDETKNSFTWKQQGFANEQGHEHSTQGMDGLLNQIKTIAER